MNKLKNKFALAGIRTYRQRIDDFCNAQYYHIQDTVTLIIILTILFTIFFI